MCEMESLVSSLQDLTLEKISISFVTFYHGVIQTQKTSNDLLENRRTLNKLRKTYTNKLRRDDPCSVCFDSMDVRCAYIFQFCPSFSLAMSWHFLKLMQTVSQQQLQRLALEDTLVICCLGGGPGTDVVAMCKVLQDVRKRFAATVNKPLMVDATVIDAENGWKTTAELVISSLPNLVDESVVKINRFRFIEHDYTKTVSEDILTVLGQSDVVTMNKFLSALHGTRSPVVRTDIMKDTWERIPEDSILFLMDSSGWNLFDEMVRTVGSLVHEEPIYGPAKKTNRMSKSSKNLCRSLSSAIYGQQCCTAQSSNKAVAWLKTPTSDSS